MAIAPENRYPLKRYHQEDDHYVQPHQIAYQSLTYKRVRRFNDGDQTTSVRVLSVYQSSQPVPADRFRTPRVVRVVPGSKSRTF